MPLVWSIFLLYQLILNFFVNKKINLSFTLMLCDAGIYCTIFEDYTSFLVIHADCSGTFVLDDVSVVQVQSVQEFSEHMCQICGDKLELTDDGELFVAGNECAFPICRPCYEYERRRKSSLPTVQN